MTYRDMTNIISQTKKLNTELPHVGKLREVHHFFALFFGIIIHELIHGIFFAAYASQGFKSIKFGENKFRKLQKLEIIFSDRITVIGGLNGIGKSTILGLIANCSGIRSSQYKSYFNALFQANFQELFHLDENDDYKEKIEDKSYIDITYLFDNIEFTKNLLNYFSSSELEYIRHDSAEYMSYFNKYRADILYSDIYKKKQRISYSFLFYMIDN